MFVEHSLELLVDPDDILVLLADQRPGKFNHLGFLLTENVIDVLTQLPGHLIEVSVSRYMLRWLLLHRISLNFLPEPLHLVEHIAQLFCVPCFHLFRKLPR